MWFIDDGDAGEAVTATEGTISDGSDRARNVDAGEAGTVREGMFFDGSDRARDDDASEAGTVIEGILFDGSDSVTFNYAFNLCGSNVSVCIDDIALPCI